MSKVIDLTGQKFNHWTVLYRAENNNRGQAMWWCECDCDAHTQRAVESYSLRSGQSKSCGCYHRKRASEANFENLIGQKFGHLTVKKVAGRDNSRKILWECECDCEGHTLITTRTTDLRSGKTQSCGCIRSRGEALISQLLNENGFKFEKEKTFETCRFPSTNALCRFDFYVNNEYLIEFDGIQHTEKTNNWYSDSLTAHDKFKEDWCKENNIPLLRISYDKIKTLKIEDLIL